MKPQRLYCFVSLFFLFAAVSLFAKTAYQRTTLSAGTTAPPIPWVDSGAKAGVAWNASTTGNYIEIYPDSQYQTIKGFGGTFQEVGANSLSHCSAAGQDSVLRALFDTSGCNMNWGRIPIGCCDFDEQRAPYSCDDSAGDFQMKAFSIARDSLKRIPLIQRAQALHPGMHFWASPWSPPGWMKSNNNWHGGSMTTNSDTLQAYALYLEKFITSYKTKGINIDWITCQNEPDENGGGYPQCKWTNSTVLDFYKNHLIPQFKQDSMTARILVGVFDQNNYSNWIPYLMGDSVVANYVGALSHSFQQPGWGDSCWRHYPTVPFIETESSWSAGASANWSTGMTTFQDMCNFYNVGKAVMFTEWNLINNQKSTSYFSSLGAQPVMIIIDTTNGNVTYEPYYWGAKHLGYYLKVGAKGIKFTSTGVQSGLTSAAFLNPNGDIIFVTGNSVAGANSVAIKVRDTMFNVVLPGNSFNTIMIPNPLPPIGTIQNMPVAGNTSLVLSSANIRNSILYLTLSGAIKMRDADLTLTDLQGRSIWTSHRTGALSSRQAIAIRPGQSNLRPGTYLLSVKIKSDAGAVTKAQKKVMAVN